MLLLAKTNLFFVVMDSVCLICEKSDSSFLEEVHTLEALTNLSEGVTGRNSYVF